MNLVSNILRLKESISIEEKLFNLSIFLATLILIIFDITYYFLMPNHYNVLFLQIIATTVILFLFYKTLIQKRFNSIYSTIFLITGYLTADLICLYTEGILGSSVFILALLSILGLLLQNGLKRKIIFLTLNSLNFLILILIYFYYPEFVLPYDNELEKKIDFIVTGSVVIFSAPLIVKFFKDAYDLDREFILYEKEKISELNIELNKEKQKSEELAKIKSDFLANMSHEIRTPLKGIIGMIENYFLSTTFSEKNQSIQTAQMSSKLLLSIVNDILDFTKIDSGKLILERINFNLEILLNETISNFLINPKVQSHSVSIKLQLDDNLDKIYSGDELRIKQILLNLISNAIKFTEEGEVLISVKKISETKLKFSIKDTGIGIKNISKLFQFFSQEDSSITRKFGGTGLGLVITKNLIGLMNGEIWVQSEYKEGSNFIFQIELFKALTENENSIKSFEENNSELVNLEILYVEDEKINQMVFSQFVKKLNQKIDLAENGLIALNQCKEKTYDIIFMDINMPIMDGIEATKKIRELKLEKQPYIITLTANIVGESKSKCLEAGMNAFLGKPFSFEQIKTAINTYLKLRNE